LPGITRRGFLKVSALSTAALGQSKSFGGALTQGLRRWGLPTPWYRTGRVQTTYTVCDMCPWRCDVIVSSVDGQVTKIDGNPADPKSRGRLCVRGQGGLSLTADPDRLTTPLIRTGERGSGEFREASWEEALDEIADRMLGLADEYGPESTAILGHTGADHWFTDDLTPNSSRLGRRASTKSPREGRPGGPDGGDRH